jgi:hypothetical protein
LKNIPVTFVVLYYGTCMQQPCHALIIVFSIHHYILTTHFVVGDPTLPRWEVKSCAGSSDVTATAIAGKLFNSIIILY